MGNRFSADYYENEIREGFFVPSMMKRAWAEELTVLGEIDRICNKYNIRYFAEWGTLLGAVRHNGFIPWDDDIDISMKRKDYERFIEVADSELPDGYKINNLRNKSDFCLFLARVMNTSHISFDNDYLREHNEFPYIAGVDIFVMDWVSNDEESENKRDTVADYTITLADCIYDRKMQISQVLSGLRKLMNISGSAFGYDEEKIRSWLSGEHTEELENYVLKLRQSMYLYAERLFGSFTEAESSELTQLFPFGLRNKYYRYPKEYYADTVRLPFEDTTIPVPLGYDNLLRLRYGDYMIVKKNRGGHGYPFYESQQEQLDKLAGVSLPSYKYTEKEAGYAKGIRKVNKGQSVKQIAKELYACLSAFDSPDEAQALAIELGTLLEENYIEHPAVHLLEEYCELLYRYAFNEIGIDEIEKVLAKIYDSIDKYSEAAFIVSKTSQWEYITPYFMKEKKSGVYIYLVVVPYYEKRFDGSLINRRYEYDDFEKLLDGKDENVHLIEYCKYDVKLHEPETIYIQNPYDEWNKGISIDKNFYTENLFKYCEKLIYVPPFDMDDFSKEDYISFKNMYEYVTVPGVVRADKVILKSESMRKTYIDKLVSWAGEKTYDIWKSKITVEKLSNQEANEEYSAMKNVIFGHHRDILIKQDGSCKRVVLYRNSVGSFMGNSTDIIAKLESVIGIFEVHKKSIAVLWYYNPIIDETLKKTNQHLLSEYHKIIQKFISMEIGIYDCTHTAKDVVAASDAYYGDIDSIVRMCERKEIPIMIEDMNC